MLGVSGRWFMERPSFDGSRAGREADCYRSNTDEPRPLGGYVGAMTAFGGMIAGFVTAGLVRKRAVPTRVTPWDVALTGVAVHKLARIITKDPVTSPLRAPFTTFAGPGGEAEVREQVREHGQARHAIGELITCPFCVAPWIGGGFVAGSVLAPKTTRLAAWTMASVAVSDFLQLGYAALQKRIEE